jgi:hypothetical protein
VEKRDPLQAPLERARFRSFLLSSIKHFLCNEWDRERALKRGGGQIPFSLDVGQHLPGCRNFGAGCLRHPHPGRRDRRARPGLGQHHAQPVERIGAAISDQTILAGQERGEGGRSRQLVPRHSESSSRTKSSDCSMPIELVAPCRAPRLPTRSPGIHSDVPQ